MRVPSELYRPNLALLADLYEFTMAYGYWRSGRLDHQACFHLTFRDNPFGGGFTVACGLEAALDFLEAFRFEHSDLAYLATLKGAGDAPLFEEPFLRFLEGLRLSVDVDAVPEGTVVFPHEPILRVVGPVLEAQILETALLNLINYPTLVATKAARLRLAAAEGEVIEFGLRRAQGIDGGLTASRAAYVGGCDSTSNLLAGMTFGIPVRGTHAHSWIMVFEDEAEAFAAWAEALPQACVFLVDTYQTLRGVERAIEVGRRLRERGHRLLGVRLDSGDLAYLSQQARRRLDEAGFPDAAVMASNELDEHLVQSLRAQGAPIGVWGVGTRLVTCQDQPALGGVYKLSAVRAPGGPWSHRIKLSEQAPKTTTPGLLRVRRYEVDGAPAGDLILDELTPVATPATMVDPLDPTRRKLFPDSARFEELLVPVIRGGRPVWRAPPLAEVRARVQDQLSRFHAGIKRFANPHRYPVGLEQGLHQTKTRLVLQARGIDP